jgi:hypothetical protein
MSALSNKLTQLEARLQSLVEGSVARLFPTSPLAHDLAAHLLEALRAGVEAGTDGLWYAPNHFTLYAHPRLAEALQVSPDTGAGARPADRGSGERFALASLPDLRDRS